MSAVVVDDVTMDFGAGAPAVANASFALDQGRFLTILGPSGSGKTTLLRMIAGFQKPTGGRITIGGRPVDASPPHRRSIGMVFQRLALFPHMTAAQNVAFPLKMRRFNPGTIPARVAEFLALVRLDGFGDRRINELSGGQQQRVAIARALVFEPELLLLDEPLASLDRKLREEMELEFRRIQHELGVTTINVTHDQREAMVVSDEVIVMENGRIQQHGPPEAVYHRPENLFVAGFLGISSFIDGIATGGGLELGGDRLPGIAAEDYRPGDPVRASIRAEQIRIAATPAGLEGCDGRIGARVEDVIFEGDKLLYIAHASLGAGLELRIYHHESTGDGAFAPGDRVALGWRQRDMKIFRA